MLPNMRPVPWRPKSIEPMRTSPRRGLVRSLSAPVALSRLSRLLHRLLRIRTGS
jgi:hypothetical protein